MSATARPARRAQAGEAALARRAAIRLGAQAAALVAAVVVVLTGVAVLVLIGAQREQATAVISSSIARADDVADPPVGVYLVLRTPDGTVRTTPGLPDGVADSAAVASAAAGGSPPATEQRRHGVEYEIATVRRDDGVVVQAVLDLTANHAERNRLLETMLLTGVAGLLAAGAAGTWLGLRALAPLSGALELQRRFVSDAGHELRTPLTLLGTRAQLLRRHLRRDPPPGREKLLADADGIVTDSARLTAILEDLLLAADPLADRPRARVDLTDLCRDVAAAAAASATGIGVTIEGPDGGPVPTQGSPAALRRAVTALTDNAIRHARSRVTVRTCADRRHAVVEVADDGDGVAPDVVPRLFDRFATGARRTEPGRRRYGLGLALVAEIAAAHDGRVELVPPAGSGATFRLSLPVADEQAPDASARKL